MSVQLRTVTCDDHDCAREACRHRSQVCSPSAVLAPGRGERAVRTLLEQPVVTVAELIGALRSQQEARTIEHPRPADPSAGSRASVVTGGRVAVIGAHPGAGTTVVTVALADAFAASGQAANEVGPMVVDGAPRELSGMSGASECEVQAGHDGWCAGRRGTVTVLRPKELAASPGQVPALPDPADRQVLIDAGWAWRAVVCGAGPVREWLDFAEIVVVCRATIPGVRHVELALGRLPGEPLVAAVGARRWPGLVRASFGPRLAEIDALGGAVLVPSDRRVEVNGVDTRPFPRPVAAAATGLAIALQSRWLAGSCSREPEGVSR